MRKIMLLLLLIGTIHSSNGQMYGNVWCFGDSVMMRFDQSNNINFSNSYCSNFESAASISDSAGNLIFYLDEDLFISQSKCRVLNAQHQLIINGDSLYSLQSTSCGFLILPYPDNPNQFVILHTSYSSPTLFALHYSLVDRTTSGGIGSVLSKNNPLQVIADSICDAVSATRHANGRDWWIVNHSLKSNIFYFYLLSPTGITYHHSQSIGSPHWHITPIGAGGGTGAMKFSNNGERLISVDISGTADCFNFDRCDGLLSNWIDLHSLVNPFIMQFYVACSFSVSGNFAYISNETSIFQYDLNSPNPAARTLVYYSANPELGFGHHLIGPDGKIYISNKFNNQSIPPSYYDTVNTHLSVINYPDSIGPLCNFQPHASHLYVGRNRKTTYSIPNLTNYNLKNILGSTCDTILTSVNESLSKKEMFTIYPNPGSDLVTIKLLNTEVEVIGIKILNDLSQCITTIFDYDLIDVKFLNNGLYIFEITTNKGVYYAKFVKE